MACKSAPVSNCHQGNTRASLLVPATCQLLGILHRPGFDSEREIRSWMGRCKPRLCQFGRRLFRLAHGVINRQMAFIAKHNCVYMRDFIRASKSAGLTTPKACDKNKVVLTWQGDSLM